LTDLDIDRLRLARREHIIQKKKEPSEDTGALYRETICDGTKHIEKLAAKFDVPMLIGAIRNVYKPNLAAQYNVSLLVDPDEGVVSAYDKLHLVPYGEYLPFEAWLPFLKFLMPYEADYNFGLDAATNYETLHLNNMHFAALICFEDTLPSLAREFVSRATPERPVDFLINQSNDGWFQGSSEADYHLAASLFRCIECRRPMARASNTGITAMIDGNGRIAKVLEQMADDGSMRRKLFADALLVDMPLDGRSTLYVRWGDWFPAICLLVCGTGVIAWIRARIGHRGG
jgi:apolipoprotein N-acyltransferase